MNTSKIGEISTLQVAVALVQKGKDVLIPFGDNKRYDIGVDENGKISRVQCKTGHIKNGSVIARASSPNRDHQYKSYQGEIEYFGVYCPDNNKCYMIPVNEASKHSINLRLEMPKNNQSKKVKWAKDYELGL